MEDEPWLLPRPDVPVRRAADFAELSTDDIAADVVASVERLARVGVETLVLDQTRPDVDLRVVRVTAPGLRHFWRRLAPGRLYDVPPRLGWVEQPVDESSVNPRVLFL